MLLRILIADDHAPLLEMLKALIETHAGWQVCGEAKNGLEAVQKAAELKPDVIILDLSMPGLDGLQAANQISLATPGIPILIYTNHAVSPQAKLEAKKHGVRDIINKTALDQLISAVEAAQPHTHRSGADEILSDTMLPGADLKREPEEN
jgi:DNA-binding NarL/FixJ family response regulator